MRTTILKENGSVRGYLIESHGRKTIIAANGSTLGYYIEGQNKTYNRQGACIGFGDQLAILLEK